MKNEDLSPRLNRPLKYLLAASIIYTAFSFTNLKSVWLNTNRVSHRAV